MGQAKLKQKNLNGGKAVSARHDHFADFVREVREGDAFALDGWLGEYPQFVDLPKDCTSKLDFGAQSYDFGQAFYTIPPAQTAEILKTCLDKINRGDFHLPNERCFFILSDDHQRGQRTSVIEAVEFKTRFSFAFWHRMALGSWASQAICIELDKGTGARRVTFGANIHQKTLDFCSKLISLVLGAALILATKPEDNAIDIAEADPAPVRQPRQNASTDPKPPLPTRIIRVRTTASRVNWSAVRPRNPQAIPASAILGTGTAKSPHDRRGHERFLKKSGKRIWIDEMKINGGAKVYRPAIVQIID